MVTRRTKKDVPSGAKNNAAAKSKKGGKTAAEDSVASEFETLHPTLLQNAEEENILVDKNMNEKSGDDTLGDGGQKIKRSPEEIRAARVVRNRLAAVRSRQAAKDKRLSIERQNMVLKMELNKLKEEGTKLAEQHEARFGATATMQAMKLPK
uniref:BZIP domain-containing protein n=1 Tax=Timspurckia oligopyrenoides TaxID=708627 RepID=A0A7S0ZDX4_9RHOD|mmetsp:Transcript_1446/g.2620  ORF Transcript_1446/g.2620 Transcript_1446/m.2620 type:complete len:152 (+) Transcript_1446:122-577(+)